MTFANYSSLVLFSANTKVQNLTLVAEQDGARADMILLGDALHTLFIKQRATCAA